MAKTTAPIDPYGDNANWSLYTSPDCICFAESNCTQLNDWSTATNPSRNKTFCRKNGRLVQDGSYEGDPETGLTQITLTVKERESYIFKKARGGKGRPACPVYLRDVMRCNGQILGWEELGAATVLSMSRINGQNIFGGSAGERQWTVTLEYSGEPVWVDAAKAKPRGFLRDSGLEFVALYQCGDGSCGGPDKCGACSAASAKHDACDHWFLVETDGTDVYVSESFDGGLSFDDVKTIAGVGQGLSASCDHIFTDQGRLKVCGASYTVEPLPDSIDTTATPIVAGDGNVMLFGNTGVLQYDSDFNQWSVVQANDPAASPHKTIVAEGCFVITAGDSDGTTAGIAYNMSADGGVSFSSLAIGGPNATTADVLLDLEISGGVITALVTNGTDSFVYYSTDGETWMLSATFAGVTATQGNIETTGGITRVQIGKMYWENMLGLCQCNWSDGKPLTNCPEAIGVCESDPAGWLYSYTA